MNLIEQLGGYENVSKHFNRIEYHAETKIFIGEWFGFYSMQDLKDALLQYRRENNIFEVGDQYVMLKIDHHDFLTVKGGEMDKPWWNTQIIRHITDAERKAGHRL